MKTRNVCHNKDLPRKKMSNEFPRKKHGHDHIMRGTFIVTVFVVVVVEVVVGGGGDGGCGGGGQVTVGQC